MAVLGVNPENIDATVSVVEKGEIKAAIQQERISRLKHDRHITPQTVAMTLEAARLSTEDIDAVAMPTLFGERLVLHYLGLFWQSLRSDFTYVNRNYADHSLWRRELARLLLQAGVKKRYSTVEHHLAHAASAHLTSGFEDSTVIVLDGHGDGVSTSVYAAEGSSMRRVHRENYRNSAGYFYGAATVGLGFRFHSEEYKVMGLAAYGKSEGPAYEFFKRALAFEEHRLRFAYNCYARGPGWQEYVAEVKNLSERLGKEAVAAALQRRLEEALLEYSRFAVEATGCSRVAIAGGVGLNVKLTRLVREKLGLKDQIFIHPHAGDGGVGVGAALLESLKNGSAPGRRIQHVYLGPEYSNEEIATTLAGAREGIAYHRSGDIAGETSELISKGKVVGWFQGRMEYGPRALGARSVLADPRDPRMRDRINFLLKQREWFMPFAPSMLAEAVGEYLEEGVESPFMTLAFEVKREKIGEIPAVVHVDGTTRPQTVRRDVNPLYYRMIEAFESIAGVPMVLNTSFNRHGLPIVCNVDDALWHLENGCVDVLAAGDYVVLRK